MCARGAVVHKDITKRIAPSSEKKEMQNYYFQSFKDAWFFHVEAKARGEFADFPRIITGGKDGKLKSCVTMFDSAEEQRAAWREDMRIEAARFLKHGY